jgi:hypothetical protein
MKTLLYVLAGLAATFAMALCLFLHELFRRRR